MKKISIIISTYNSSKLQSNLNPDTRVMLSRFFDTKIIKKAFNNIPVNKLKEVVAESHAILYYEVTKLSGRIALIPYTVGHIEKNDPTHLMKSKRRPRGFMFSHPYLSAASNLLVLLKFILYRTGEIRYQLARKDNKNA